MKCPLCAGEVSWLSAQGKYIRFCVAHGCNWCEIPDEYHGA